MRLARCRASSSHPCIARVPRRQIASATFDARRNRNRRLWVFSDEIFDLSAASSKIFPQKETPPSHEPEYILFPDERLGNQIDVNWSLCRIGMPPNGEAYRNLHLRALVSLAPGSVDAKKTLQVKTPEARSLLLQKASTEHRTAARTIKQDLAASQSLFVHDASTSTAHFAPVPPAKPHGFVSIKPSTPGGNPVTNPVPPAERLGPANPNHLRFITDNVHTAIALHHMMPAARLGDPWFFVAGSTLLHASTATAPSVSLPGGADSNDFFVYNNDAGEALLNGGIQHVLETIGIAGAAKMWPHAVPLRGAFDSDRNLYLGSPEQLASASAALLRKGKLVAAHQVYWGDQGIAAAFKGALLAPSPNSALGRGDINFVNINRAVHRLSQRQSVFGHPAKIVLLSDSKKESSVATADAVATIVGKDGVLSSHMPAFDRVSTVDVKSVAEKLQSLLKLANTSVQHGRVELIAA